MSKYTTEVRFICETAAGKDSSEGFNSELDIVNAAYPSIFAADLTLFDDAYKAVLFPKILLHFYTREIGFETVGLWKHHLNQKLREILPYYNQLYNSELVEFNPLENVNKTTTHDERNVGDRDETGRSHSDDTGNASTWDKFSDTPQGGLSGIENDTYLTSANNTTTEHDNDVDNNYTTNTDTVDTTVYSHKEIGKTGAVSYSEMLTKWRSTFLNIDAMLISELEDLFMLIW